MSMCWSVEAVLCAGKRNGDPFHEWVFKRRGNWGGDGLTWNEKTGSNSKHSSGAEKLKKTFPYVQDNIYAETADVMSTLPDKAVSIGTIEKVVLQDEPMVRENFTSNLLQVSSEIYYDESNSSVVYVEILDSFEETYN